MQEYDVIVIGSGPGGYVAAIRAAQLQMKTLVVEKAKLGGTCLNVGCIPSKALLHSTEMYYKINHKAKDLGILSQNLSYSLEKMRDHKEHLITSSQNGIAALFKKNKVDLVQGMAAFTSKDTIEVNHQVYKAKSFIIATGSESLSLPFAPFDEEKVLSSSSALQLKNIPASLLVVGAGVIGVELGSVYSRLGSKVSFVEFLPRICSPLDTALAQGLQKILEKQGMSFRLSSKLTRLEKKGSGVQVEIEGKTGMKETLLFDAVLVSIGRRPNTEGLSLEKAGVALNEKGQISVNSSFQTSTAHIYAIGDVIDGPMLAHKASEEGVAVAELIAGKSPKLDYIAIPSVVYTYPEMASVGLSEEECKQYGRDYIAGQFPFLATPRARANLETDGFVKVLADKKTGKLLGLHILGEHAGEMIMEGVIALKKRMTAEELGELCHAHPSLSEAIKEACLATCQKAIHK